MNTINPMDYYDTFYSEIDATGAHALPELDHGAMAEIFRVLYEYKMTPTEIWRHCMQTIADNCRSPDNCPDCLAAISEQYLRGCNHE